MVDLLLPLPGDMGVRAGLEQELRSAIRDGRLAAGVAVPSTRAIAADLGIARSTVVAAFEQLAIEGYLVARQGRSTVVADIARPEPERPDSNPMGPTPRHDFRPGEPSAGSFPRREWQRSMRRVLAEAPDELFGYGDPRGRVELRTSLTDYLGRARGVNVAPSAIRIFSGYASSLGFIAEALLRRGVRRIAVEQPMLPFHRQILELVGLATVRVPLDDEGLVVDELRQHDVGAVVVTPANNQGLSITMSPGRRADLVAWARECDAFIVEDDYDGEFRYDGNSIGAMQGLDAARVLYAGTASKSLGPGVHLSWCVVPAGLRRDLAAVTHLRAGVSTIGQVALADLITRGAYDRHIRKRRKVYRERALQLCELLEDFDWLDVRSVQAGMSVTAKITGTKVSERDVMAAADDASLAVIGLQTHFEHDEAGLLLSFARAADHAYAASCDVLYRVLTAAARE